MSIEALGGASQDRLSLSNNGRAYLAAKAEEQRRQVENEARKKAAAQQIQVRHRRKQPTTSDPDGDRDRDWDTIFGVAKQVKAQAQAQGGDVEGPIRIRIDKSTGAVTGKAKVVTRQGKQIDTSQPKQSNSFEIIGTDEFGRPMTSRGTVIIDSPTGPREYNPRQVLPKNAEVSERSSAADFIKIYDKSGNLVESHFDPFPAFRQVEAQEKAQGRSVIGGSYHNEFGKIKSVPNAFFTRPTKQYSDRSYQEVQASSEAIPEAFRIASAAGGKLTGFVFDPQTGQGSVEYEVTKEIQASSTGKPIDGTKTELVEIQGPTDPHPKKDDLIYFAPEPTSPSTIISIPQEGKTERINAQGQRERYSYDKQSGQVNIEYPDMPATKAKLIKPESNDPVAGFLAPFYNIRESVLSLGDLAQGKESNPRFKAELEGQTYESISKGRFDIRLGGLPMGSVLFTPETYKNLGELGGQFGEAPLYYGGSAAGSAITWLATLGGKPAVQGGKAALGAVAVRRTESALQPFIATGAKLEPPVRITIEPPVQGSRIINIGLESSTTKFGVGVIKPTGKVGFFERRAVQSLPEKERLVPSKQLTGYAQRTVKIDLGEFPTAALKITDQGPIQVNKAGDIFERTLMTEGKEPVFLKAPQQERVVAIEQEMSIGQLKALGSSKEGVNRFFGISETGTRVTSETRSNKPASPFTFEPKAPQKTVTRETVEKLIQPGPEAKSPIQVLSKPAGATIAAQKAIGLGGGGYKSTGKLGLGGATGVERKRSDLSSDIESVFLPTPLSTKHSVKVSPKSRQRTDLFIGTKSALGSAGKLDQSNVSRLDQALKSSLDIISGSKVGFNLTGRTGQGSRVRTDLIGGQSTSPISLNGLSNSLRSGQLGQTTTRQRTPTRPTTTGPPPGGPLLQFPPEQKRRVKGRQSNLFGSTRGRNLGVTNVFEKALSLPTEGRKRKGKKGILGF